MACFKKETGTKEERETNARINDDIKQAKKGNTIKLLLLGTGESGKSTIAKQMKIIHLNGYGVEEERVRFRAKVFSNIYDNITALASGAKANDIEISDQSKEAAERILAAEESFRANESLGFSKELVQDIKNLWNDPGIQTTFLRSVELNLQLNDSVEYFFENIDRIKEDGYIPNILDVLKVRVKTTGINEIEFTLNKYKFSMTDVGGQRSERRKWIHVFENVTALIFCVAISEYDQKLQEDLLTNRMMESLKLFSDLTNSRWFANTPVILFFNKMDIFANKITKVPLNVCFKNYKGANNVEEAGDYIQKQFLDQNTNPDKMIFCFKTCGTDTNNVKHIFDSVKDIIISSFLNQLGIGMSSAPSGHTKHYNTDTVNGHKASRIYKEDKDADSKSSSLKSSRSELSNSRELMDSRNSNNNQKK